MILLPVELTSFLVLLPRGKKTEEKRLAKEEKRLVERWGLGGRGKGRDRRGRASSSLTELGREEEGAESEGWRRLRSAEKDEEVLPFESREVAEESPEAEEVEAEERRRERTMEIRGER